MTDELQRSRGAFITALKRGDETAAQAVVDQLRAQGVPAPTIYYDVFAPSMVTIGELWEQNELTVAEEHLATSITERLIGQLSPSFNQPVAPVQRGSVLLGCVAGERHVLGLRMLADLFREQGWRVLYLGGDVPDSDWIRLAVRVSADVVAISASSERLVPHVRSLIEELRSALPTVAILVGGAVFARHPDLWLEVGASLYDANPHQAVALATARYGVDAAQGIQP